MDFRSALRGSSILLLDGAMGTMLQKSGLPAGTSPERFCLANPEILRSIHESYLQAGSSILTTCTFGANPAKLDADIDLFSFNKEMAQIARWAAQSCERDVYVAGNVGPTGLFVRPLGPVEPGKMKEDFASQIRGLVAGGVDLIFIETQFDLAEARLAVIAAREVTDLPVMVSMTFEDGLSLTGSSPEIFAETMSNLSCDVIGTNCSVGPEQMKGVVESLLANANCAVMAEPNAGLPILKNGVTEFPLGPEEFAEKTSLFADLGCRILGGCCGTSPAHIAELAKRCRHKHVPEREKKENDGIVLTSRSECVRIGKNQPFVLIGERINPTGKKALTHELQNSIFSLSLQYADEQIASHARIIDCNVGAPLVDEADLLPRLVELLVGRIGAPLSLDSSNEKAICAALPYCTGSFLINSISGEGDRMERLAPLCRRYGAPFILLPLAGKELPVEAKKRLALLETLLKKAGDLNIPKRLLLIDILALTVSSSPGSALTCLEMLRFCESQHLPTTLGLSNISFGLPARDLINASFLAMACGCGLTSCIANPQNERIQETLAGINLLRNHDSHAERFIAEYADWKAQGRERAEKKTSSQALNLYDCVLLGKKEACEGLLEKALGEGKDPFLLVQDVLIPAITEVGAKYERKEYFLPQLIRSAETMQFAFAHLKPLLEKSKGTEKRPCIVMATVEGDIHDIGKNIVSLLLSNHGFEVIDAGKDVAAKDIVRLAVEHDARLIGLSALMTTTMVRMEDTIELVRKDHLPIKVVVGGAAVTQSFADTIGADAYCRDAVAAVQCCKALLGA